MDCNGNNISENPFLKQDNAGKRLIRRRPIIIRDTDTKKSDTGFKMRNSSDVEGSLESPNNAHAHAFLAHLIAPPCFVGRKTQVLNCKCFNMNLRRHSLYLPDFWKPSDYAPSEYQNLDYPREPPPVSRRLGAAYVRSYSQRPDSTLKRRIARTQSERKPGNDNGYRPQRTGFEIPRIPEPLQKEVIYTNLPGSDHNLKWSMSLERKRSFNHHLPSEYENLSQFSYRPEHKSCSDLTQPFEMYKPTTISFSYHNLSQDLEYGPGIVEKLRAKFSKLSGAQKQQQQEKNVQAKKYSSCDDLLSESDAVNNVLKSNHAPVELQRRTSRSISDMLENEEIGTKPFAPRNVKLNEEEEAKSISQLRRRFEKNGEQVTKMRFARDPVQLITKFQPDHVDPWRSNTELNRTPITLTNSTFISHKPPPVQRPIEVQSQAQHHKTSNVLKILNDADSNQGEPEFVQIARRLRRFQPEHTHDTPPSPATNAHIVINNNIHKPTSLPPTPTQTAPVRPATLSMWQRRQPEVPQFSDAAKIIRENCDIAVLPPDPHSARVSKQPIPSIGSDISSSSGSSISGRSNTPSDASPPPEEPKSNVLETYAQFRKTIVDISSDRTSAVNSVKYDNPSPAIKSPITTNNLWKPTINSPSSMSSESSTVSSPAVSAAATASKLPFISRKVDDVGVKSMITSNVVSISVKAPVSNWIHSNYDKPEDTPTTPTTSESMRSTAPLKPPLTYSPSYTTTSLNSVSLSSKYVEEKSKTTSSHQQQQQQQPINSSLNGLLSPREKPYGDDVTILKSEPTNESQKLAEPTATNIIAHQDDSDTNSDGDSNDGNGSYDITPMRPNSLVFTRLANEEEMGGDGNVISRSLLSLVAEEDLPDFLVALNEKPIRYVVVEETEKPSTSSILRSRDVQKVEKAPKGTTRIRFCTENPMAYAYLDEYTATRSLSWDDGTVIEYSYFKDLEAAEEAALSHNDPTLALIEQWEQQIANDNIRPLTHDLAFSDSRIEPTTAVSSVY
ncbi:hypothetical protein L3Y34_011606 [Caenorhabditis briggsae]|uniref:Uncharacterized protein n=2 Tax=Caenorhabditis briggsae TaxID=6238 RepID=A0AAE9CU51_CAEBR|nr:hypothetical protein L3Y34_011606 [Caenorhabditis briggsae]